MKKLILSLLSVFALSSISFAQTTSEAFLFSNNNQIFGTARFSGLSGAFGALGGDLSAVSQNPAASAVFTESFGSVTISGNKIETEIDYFGTLIQSEEDTFLSFDQIGGVLILNENDHNTRIKKIALGFNYNKTIDFDESYFYSGSPGNTIGDFFAGQANGIPNGDLEIFDGESVADTYVAIGNTPEYGAVGQQAFLGFQSGIINPVNGDDLNGLSYVSNSNGSATTQDTRVVSSGSAGKFSLNLAAAYESGLHLGGNLNLHTFNRRKDVVLVEQNNISRIQYNVSEDNVGAGISGDIGLIYKLQGNLRLGLVYQTPIYYSIVTDVDQFISNDLFVNEGDQAETFVVDPAVVFENELYTLQTPGKFAASAAYVFGKKGLLSFEYSSQDFSNIEYGDGFSGANEINNLIEITFERVNTYRLGAEIRNNNWTLRGGVSRSSSPYQDDNFGGDSQGFSLGTGYDGGQWRFDISYNHLNVTSTETTFENNLFTNTANLEEDNDRITATLGISF